MTFRQKNNLLFWRILTHFWGLLVACFFLLTFFNIVDLDHCLKSVAIVYISILSIFTSVKEFHRWRSESFFSKHQGEIFIILYSAILIVFVIMYAFAPNQYQLPAEFVPTYISILGIFAITYNSKYLKNK